MLFKINNGSVSYGADTVLENINFEVKDKEKIAVVGRNGCGKTTLLKAITGEVALEEGTGEETFAKIKSGSPVIGYLRQISFENDDTSMIEELLKVFKQLTDAEEKMKVLLAEIEKNADEKKINEYGELCEKYDLLGGYTYKKEYSVMIRKFGFSEEDKNKSLGEFSGGQRTKIAFMKLLLSKPDILLLDEPTNHLDVNAIEWLEDYLKNYKSAVVIVSHDRMFINKTVSKVYEIEYGETRCYRGNYSEFERAKRENYEKQLKDHDLQRAEIQRLTKLIERFRYKATKAAMVQSKIKLIERMKIIDRPNRYDLKAFHAEFEPARESVKGVLKLTDLVIGYDAPLLTVNLEVNRGEKLGVIGGNGIGKSTLLKTVTGIIPKLGGLCNFGMNVDVGYFDQKMAEYYSEKTVIDDFHDEFPLMTETEVRKALGSFLFSGEDVFKTVSALSGGERVRLSLCKIFKRRPNVLVLDEPTNHLDIVGKETLEDMLKEYTGTVIFVSHDRYFVNKIADKLLVIESGKAEFYPVGFAEYEIIKKEKTAKNDESFYRAEADIEQKSPVKSSTAIVEATAKKAFTTPLKEKAKKERRAAKLEDLIAKTESETEMLNLELSKPEVYSDYKKVAEIQDKLNELAAQKEEYTEEWLSLLDE